MLDEVAQSAESTERAQIVAHYERVAPLIAKHFAGTPLIALFQPNGPDHPVVRVGQLHKEIPQGIPHVAVTTRTGTHAYVALTEHSLLWRVHTRALGFESWTPTATDPLAVRFARLILSQRGAATVTMLRRAAHVARAALQACGVDALPLLDGRSIALFIPFDDAPGYDAVRAWLHAVMADAAAREPDLFEFAPGAPPDRIHISAQSDAPGHGSALPYTLRPESGFAMVTPCTWAEFDIVATTAWSIENAAERLAHGDVFASEIERIGAQRFADVIAAHPASASLASPTPPPSLASPASHAPRPRVAGYDLASVIGVQPRSDVITVAAIILADGKPRTADEILAEAIARDLWPRDERRKYVYAELKGYVEKMIARGLYPPIVQDGDRRFRINHPADDLPDPAPAASDSNAPDPTALALAARLKTAAAGDDPTAFETAVLAACEPIGFAATHVGGNANPDGYIDAILGVLGYRVMIECKLNAKPLVRPDIAEAAKFRDAYGAQHAIMIANSYAAEKETLDECRNHTVALWTVADLLRLIELGANAFEIRPLFAPGLAAGALADLEWSRAHGPRKRLTVICDALLATGWAAQRAAADFHAPTDAPLLTEDAGIMLVDQYLAAHDSHTACTRDDIRNAFAYLTSPRIGRAVWADASRSSIVMLVPQYVLESSGRGDDLS